MRHVHRLDSFLNRLRAFELRHADQLRQSLVHRIHRNTGRFQAVTLLKQLNIRLMRNTPHEETVGRLLVFEEWQRRFVKLRDQLCRLLGLC